MKKAGLLFLSLLSVIGINAQRPAQEDEFEGAEHDAMLHQMVEQRGGDSDYGRYSEEMQHYRQSGPQQLSANWTYINESGSPNNDVGRTNSVTLDTLNPGRFYVCTPHSGIWMTNNDGLSYTPIGDGLPTLCTSRLLIDPSNTNVLYVATGTHNMDMPANSMGVYKSTDGGVSWNSTGLAFSPAAAVTIGDLIMNPLNHHSLIAATTDGLYRTYNDGLSWAKIMNDTFYSVRFKPGDTAVQYAAGHRYYRTDDGWTNWAMVTSTFVNSYSWRFEFAVRVSAATPGVVYLMTDGGNIGPGIRSYIHKSTDDGWSFTLIDSLVGMPCDQFDVSQQTPGKYIVGYWTVYKRENASSSLLQMTANTTSTLPYVHSDQRGIFFDPRDDHKIYLCNDGGITRSTDNGITFQNLTANMQLAHIYNFGESQTQPYKILTAPLDVSPFLIGSSGISRTYPMVEAFVCGMSPVNDNVYMMGYWWPYFTDDDWATSAQSSNTLAGNTTHYPKTFQYSEWHDNVNYFGNQNQVFRSTDYGLNHPLLTQTTFTYSWLYELDVSRADSNYIYLRYPDSLLVTADGVTFSNITNGLPFGTVNASSVTIDPQNPQCVWVTFSGYSAGNKVFYSSNAGQTWTNMSAGIPNIPVNELVCQRGGPPGAVYAAADGAVFYRDNSFTSWQLFSAGLPPVIVTSLDIQYNIGKIRASTFGRGMWESDLYAPSGISAPEESSVAISVFPNPSSGIVHVRKDDGSLGEVCVTDITGRTIAQFSATGNELDIDVSSYAPGCYFIRTKEHTFRLVKN